MNLGGRLLLVVALAGASGAAGQAGQLTHVAAQRQLGPVAYRDPLGAASPDGAWLATTSGLHLYVRPLAGGPIRELGPGTERVNEIVWSPDSAHLYAHESNYERTRSSWYRYDPRSREREAATIFAPVLATARQDGGAESSGDLRELSFAPGGDLAAAVVRDGERTALWRIDLDAGSASVVATGPRVWATAWHPDGTIACVVGADRVLTRDCGGDEVAVAEHVYGPIAVDTDGALVFAQPDDTGTLDLWQQDANGTGRRLTRFSRDGYAPTLLGDGDVVFRVQDYRISIALVPAEGGDVTAVTAFQSETPSWDWSGERLAFTYGSWRRIIDDAHYPDINQHVGIVDLGQPLPAAAPHQTVRSSYSEDQGMHWSPNGRWIVLHSHADDTDDLWLQPADGSAPARPITRGGNETGWPRWSVDGRTIIYPTEMDDGTGRLRGTLMTVGIDPETGVVTQPASPLTISGYEGSVSASEFAPDGRAIYFESHDGIGQRSLRRVALTGGPAEIIHAYESEQWFSALGVSPDDAWLAFIAPASDGHFQVFRVPTRGGTPEQLTFDATDKTHPTWSPRGDRIAFAVFTYQSNFWRLRR